MQSKTGRQLAHNGEMLWTTPHMLRTEPTISEKHIRSAEGKKKEVQTNCSGKKILGPIGAKIIRRGVLKP
jgi:hypothetical protein